MPAVMTAAYTATPLAALTKIIVEATRPLSAGINFVPRSEYRQIMVTAAAAASPADFLTAWEAKFGALNASRVGTKIYVRITAIDSSGRRSQPLSGSTIVIA